MTFISDLVLRTIVSVRFLLYSLRQNSKFGVYMHLGIAECHVAYCVTVTLTSDLVLIMIVSGAYL